MGLSRLDKGARGARCRPEATGRRGQKSRRWSAGRRRARPRFQVCANCAGLFARGTEWWRLLAFHPPACFARGQCPKPGAFTRGTDHARLAIVAMSRQARSKPSLTTSLAPNSLQRAAPRRRTGRATSRHCVADAQGRPVPRRSGRRLARLPRRRLPPRARLRRTARRLHQSAAAARDDDRMRTPACSPRSSACCASASSGTKRRRERKGEGRRAVVPSRPGVGAGRKP